jgi:hypothetical protein
MKQKMPRKLKKAIRWLYRQFDSIGPEVTEERCQELIAECAYWMPDKLSAMGVARVVWQEEMERAQLVQNRHWPPGQSALVRMNGIDVVPGEDN